jgi:acetyl-CoA carboxylase carboxyl transferase subunit alpha
MMENAYYSVISPEGCAAILWKDRKYATEAAQALKLSANDLLDLGIIDQVIPEPMGGAHHDHVGAANNLKSMVNEQLLELDGIPERDLLDQRYDKYRKFGEFREKGRKS